MKTARGDSYSDSPGGPGAFLADFFRTFRWKDHKPALIVIALTCLYILICWILVYLVDARGLYEIGADRGMWWHLFRNRAFVEWGQWTFLALITLTAAAVSGISRERGQRAAQVFWFLVAASFVLMVIEDAGDPRHVLAEYGAVLFGIKRMYTEGAFFLFILTPLVIALVRHWRVAFSVPPQTRLYYLLGCFLYGVAASASLFREEGGFYHIVGERLSQALTYGNVPAFFLMDFVLEESVELLATSLIFAGMIMYWKTAVRRR